MNDRPCIVSAVLSVAQVISNSNYNRWPLFAVTDQPQRRYDLRASQAHDFLTITLYSLEGLIPPLCFLLILLIFIMIPFFFFKFLRF